MVPWSLDRFCYALTTVVTLKVDFSEGKAKGPHGGLKSHFRNAKKLRYFLAEIKVFWFSVGGNRNRVSACDAGASLPQSSPVPTPGLPYLHTQGVHPVVVQRL